MAAAFLVATFSAIPQSQKHEAASCISVEETQLASMLNAYLVDHKLPPIPISADLMLVARTHVRDLAANHPRSFPL
jgi:hypothetical protein